MSPGPRNRARTLRKSRISPTSRIFLGMAGLVLLAGCATGGGSREADPPAGPVRVEVDNRGTYNVVVYARYRGQSHRLGEVTALDEQTLALGSVVPSGVRVSFHLRTIGPSARFTSQDYFVDGGDVVVIRVLPNIRQSTVSIR